MKLIVRRRAGMKCACQALVLLVGGAALTGLAGCSHSCVPAGWYGARSVPAPQQPPGAPPVKHDKSFAIPGGAPQGKPSRAQACLVYPPDVLAPHPASGSGSANRR